MTQKKLLQIILWSAVALWVILALFLTLQNGMNTAATSNWIARKVYRVIDKCGIRVYYSELHQALRTSAHFLVFFVFGVLLESALRVTFTQTGILKECVLALAFCTCIATIPEIVKIWIPGRHLQWSEVLLNVIGAYTGVFGAYAIWKIGHYLRYH